MATIKKASSRKMQVSPAAGSVKFGGRGSRGRGFPSPRPTRKPAERGVPTSWDARPNGAFKNPAPTNGGNRGSGGKAFADNDPDDAATNPRPVTQRGFNPRFSRKSG